MRCAQTQPAGGPCRRIADASVSAGPTLTTVMCAPCCREACRRVPQLVVRWLRRRRAPGRAS